MNTGDMEKYCPKPHPVYFNAFSMWQQLSGSVQYLIKINIASCELALYYIFLSPVLAVIRFEIVKQMKSSGNGKFS